MTPRPWLYSARFDLCAFTLPALLSLLVGSQAGALALPDGSTPTWAWALLVLGIDVAHVHGTTVRIYLDPAELRRRAALYLAVPLLSLGIAVSAYAASPRLFWRFLAYVAAVHFVRQQLGWLRLYRRAAGERSPWERRLDEATIYAATLYPLIAWHARLGAGAADAHEIHWFVAGDFAGGLPAWCAQGSEVVWALLLAAFAGRQIVRAMRGEPLPWGKILLVATTAATWWAGIVLWRSDFAFTVTNVVAHGVPYIAVSQRVGSPRPDGEPPPPLRALFAPGRLAPYVAALIALAFVEEWLWDRAVWNDHAALFPGPFVEAAGSGVDVLLVPLLALPQLTHYILDGYVWRLDGSNPGLAEALELAPATPSPAAAAQSASR